MSDCMRALRVCLCLVPLHVAVVSLFAGTEGTPSELSKSDWTKIRQQHERHRRAAFPVGGEYHARNPRDRWLARFDRRGFLVTPDGKDWTWGLQLLSYGFGNSLHTLTGKAHATTDVEHVNYTWNSALEEWFINGQEGLEHGFTLRKRPGGLSNPSAPLVLNIAVRGDLRPRVYADSSGVSFTDRQEIALVEYAGLKVWDADNKPVVARFEVAGAYLRLLVEEHAAKYPLTIDPVAQGSYLKASNAETDDGFGVSVAIDGDTVVVGALAEKSGAAGVNGNDNDNSIHAAGAAYVFVRQRGAWSQQAYLKASNPGDQDLFGFSVAISGDTVVVGAEQESSGAAGVNADQDNNSKPLSGAAYVFVRTAGVWSQQAYLKASNPDALDQFGRSVAISGDTIVVGANQEGSTATIINGDQSDNSGHVVGAAYVFVRNGSAWSQQAYLKPSSESHHFGISVAAAGDTVAVGAFETADAYVFVRSGDAWSEQAHLTYPDLQSNFGASVALSGETLVIGAPWAVENNGAAYVYVRSGGTWRPQAELGASHSGTSKGFGAAVAISGEAIVVGVPYEASNATGVDGTGTGRAADSGAAYVFTRSGSVWSPYAYLKASNANASDLFGGAVGLSGDTIAVGAYQEDSNAKNVNGDEGDNSAAGAGAAYIFNISPAPSCIAPRGPAPVLTLTPNVLWPPDRRLVEVTAKLQTDTCDPRPKVKLVSITSSEKGSGLEPGDLAKDIQQAALGTNDRKFLLRAERYSKVPPGVITNKGRVYTVTYDITDSGVTRRSKGQVKVPFSR